MTTRARRGGRRSCNTVLQRASARDPAMSAEGLKCSQASGIECVFCRPLRDSFLWGIVFPGLPPGATFYRAYGTLIGVGNGVGFEDAELALGGPREKTWTHTDGVGFGDAELALGGPREKTRTHTDGVDCEAAGMVRLRTRAAEGIIRRCAGRSGVSGAFSYLRTTITRIAGIRHHYWFRGELSWQKCWKARYW